MELKFKLFTFLLACAITSTQTLPISLMRPILKTAAVAASVALSYGAYRLNDLCNVEDANGIKLGKYEESKRIVDNYEKITQNSLQCMPFQAEQNLKNQYDAAKKCLELVKHGKQVFITSFFMSLSTFLILNLHRVEKYNNFIKKYCPLKYEKIVIKRTKDAIYYYNKPTGRHDDFLIKTPINIILLASTPFLYWLRDKNYHTNPAFLPNYVGGILTGVLLSWALSI